MNLDIPIKRFAEQMQIELINNSYKEPGFYNWKGIYTKVADFEYHKSKMMIAIRTGDKLAVKEYIADCANILLSIGLELGLYENETENSGVVSELKEIVFNHVPIDKVKISKSFTENI